VVRFWQVSYRRSTSTHLSLHVPLDAAVNRDAVESYKERQVGLVTLVAMGRLQAALLRCTPSPRLPFQAKRQKLKDSSASAYIGAGPLDGGEAGGGGNGVGAVVTSDGGKDVSRWPRVPPAVVVRIRPHAPLA
jgi:hypothetical protein